MTIARDLSKILDANGDLNIDANTLFVDSSTNSVGIGTSSPASKFEVEDSVNGDMHLRINNTNTGASARTFLLMQSDGATGGLYLNGANSVGSGTNQADSMTLTSDATASNGLNINATSGAIKFYYNNSETMRIDSSGNVLIGTTDSGVGGTTNTGIALNPNGASAISRSSNPSITLNRTTTDGDIALFRKDGTTVGSIGTEAGDLFIGTGDTNIKFIDGVDAINPSTATGTGRDNAIDLGRSSSRFKDLYLGGNIYLGGTGSANALDDYEEGTWTPTLVPSSGTITINTSQDTLLYTKIGRNVWISGRLKVSAISSPSGGTKLGGLPFTVGNYTDEAEVGSFSCFTFGVDLDADALCTFLEPLTNQNYLQITQQRDDASWSGLDGSKFAVGDYITFQGMYVTT